jgi:hypothetical protein
MKKPRASFTSVGVCLHYCFPLSLRAPRLAPNYRDQRITSRPTWNWLFHIRPQDLHSIRGVRVQAVRLSSFHIVIFLNGARCSRVEDI